MTFHKNSCMYVPTRSLTTENSNFSRSSDPDIFSNFTESEGWEGFCLNVNDNCNNCNHYHYLCAFASADLTAPRCVLHAGWHSAYNPGLRSETVPSCVQLPLSNPPTNSMLGRAISAKALQHCKMNAKAPCLEYIMQLPFFMR